MSGKNNYYDRSCEIFHSEKQGVSEKQDSLLSAALHAVFQG